MADLPLVSRLARTPRFRAIIEKFVPRMQEKLEAMQVSADAGDYDELAVLAHWLKGSAGTVGFDAFSEPAQALEQYAREGRAPEIAHALRRLRDMAARVEIPQA